MKVAVAVDANMGLDSPVSFRFGRAPLFAIVDIDNGQISRIEIIPNPNLSVRGGAGPATAQWLLSLGVNAIIVPRIGPNAAAALSTLGIQVLISPPGMPLREALRMHNLIS